MITQMESSCIYTGKGLARRWSEPRGRRDRVGAVKVHSRMWSEMAILRATGGSVLEGISSEVVGWLSPFSKHVLKRFP
jgi:hypothetical protein